MHLWAKLINNSVHVLIGSVWFSNLVDFFFWSRDFRIGSSRPCLVSSSLYNRFSKDHSLRQWQVNDHFHTNRHVQSNENLRGKKSLLVISQNRKRNHCSGVNIYLNHRLVYRDLNRWTPFITKFFGHGKNNRFDSFIYINNQYSIFFNHSRIKISKTKNMATVYRKCGVKPCFASHGLGLRTFIVEQTDLVNK